MSAFITKERKLELRKRAADAARSAVIVAASTIDPFDEETEYMQRYMNALAKKITHGVFVDEADL